MQSAITADDDVDAPAAATSNIAAAAAAPPPPPPGTAPLQFPWVQPPLADIAAAAADAAALFVPRGSAAERAAKWTQGRAGLTQQYKRRRKQALKRLGKGRRRRRRLAGGAS